MYPPIFETCSVDPNVQTNLGASPCRLYPFGEAPQSVVKPYAVWQGAGGGPENYLNQVPDLDQWVLRVDVYGTTEDQARDAAQALRDAIEPEAHIMAWQGESKDPDTDLYNVRFIVNWFTNRENVS